MKTAEIKQKARALGINPMHMKKPDVIRAIQKAEGNTPCFASDIQDCPHTDCCWREDCMS